MTTSTPPLVVAHLLPGCSEIDCTPASLFLYRRHSLYRREDGAAPFCGALPDARVDADGGRGVAAGGRGTEDGGRGVDRGGIGAYTGAAASASGSAGGVDAYGAAGGVDACGADTYGAAGVAICCGAGAVGCETCGADGIDPSHAVAPATGLTMDPGATGWGVWRGMVLSVS